MEFSLLKSVFVNSLQFASKSLPTKSTNPIMKTFLISADEQGISFRANSRNSQSYLLLKGAEAKKQGSICVDYIILNAISLFDDGEIKFSFAKNKLVVSQGKRKHQIAWFDPETEKFPKKEEVENYREYDPTKLFEVLSRLNLTIGPGTQKPHEQAFFLNTHEKFITSGDGVSFSYYSDFEFPLLEEDKPFPMALPYATMVMSSVPSFSRSEGDRFFISLGNQNAFKIVSENIEREFRFSSFQGEYSQAGVKAIRKALEIKPTLQVKVQKEVLIKLLSICKMYSDRALDEGKTNSTLIMISQAEGVPQVQLKMNVKGIADEVIEPIPTTDLLITDETFTLKFHPGNLLEAVKLIVSPTVELRFFDYKRPFIMLDSEVPQYVYLQTPMLLPKEVEKKEVTSNVVAAVTP
jgi:DNA polymerase III sliding clamp (beta) subunit (PCNA family)